MMGDGDTGDLIETDILTAAEDYVKHCFRDHDPSHDWHHVHRVRLMAMNLTRCPSLGQGLASIGTDEPACDLLVVELAALFHDLCDAKYAHVGSRANGAKAPTSAKTALSDFFAPFLDANIVVQQQVDLVYRIVDSVSWSKEEARRERMRQPKREGHVVQADIEQDAWENATPEFKCVSDADRLDSIGSIGIMRVSAFSANRNRPLYIPPNNPDNDPVPPAEQASGYNGSAVAHFHEKLLKIRGDRLKTDMARKEADRRQAMMASFLTELDLELMTAHQGAQLALLE